MMDLWWLFMGIAALVIIFQMMSPGRLKRGLKEARTSGEIAGIVAAIEEAKEKHHPNLWDQAIGRLWEDYHREAALDVIVAAARRSQAPVIQFWIKKAMEVEPKLAKQKFSDEFLETYFRPAVAARCGRVSCCM